MSLVTTVPNFFKEFKPHLPFRYITKFYTNGLVSDEMKLQYAVSSVKVTAMDCDTTTGAFYFGTGYMTIPIFDTSARSIDITFEETDAMDVLNMLDRLIAYQRDGQPYVIGIGVKQFDEQMDDVTSSRLYSCLLADYDEPQFSRSGGVSLVTVTARFIILSEKEWTATASVQTNFGKVALDTQDDLSEMLTEMIGKLKAETYIEGLGSAASTASEATKDFDVSDDEVAAALAKIQAEDAHGKNITKEQLMLVMKNNAKKMAVAKKALEEKLAASGIKVSVNAYNDAGHETGVTSDSGSHLLGQKIDLTFLDANGKKITAENMTAEQKSLIESAAKAAGLVANYETTGGAESLWGDFALENAYAFDASGKVITNKKLVAWTNGKAKNTSSGAYQEIGTKKTAGNSAVQYAKSKEIADENRDAAS